MSICLNTKINIPNLNHTDYALLKNTFFVCSAQSKRKNEKRHKWISKINSKWHHNSKQNIWQTLLCIIKRTLFISVFFARGFFSGSTFTMNCEIQTFERQWSKNTRIWWSCTKKRDTKTAELISGKLCLRELKLDFQSDVLIYQRRISKLFVINHFSGIFIWHVWPQIWKKI